MHQTIMTEYPNRASVSSAVIALLLLAASSASAAQILGIYTFEAASPAAFNDVSGQGLNPTTIGAAALSGSGYEGQAASFAGGTPISIPLNINPAVNPTLTIGAWVRPNDLSNRGLFGHDNGGWDRGLDLISSTWRTTGGNNHNSGIAGDLSNWQFVAIRYDGVGGQDVKLYVDTATYTRTLTAGAGATNMVIGAYTVAGVHAFSGLVDNFFIFDDALTDAEVETIRLNGLAGINTVAGFAATPPQVSALSPANGAGAASASADLVATFDEDVKKGAGDIPIREFVGDAILHTIAVSSGAVTISGAAVTINPPSDLATGVQYYVEIANGAILDLTDDAFTGISGNATWNFTTGVSLANGTAIGIDFGPTPPSDNFNFVSAHGNSTILPGGVTETSGVGVVGVGFTVAAPSGWSNNDAASSTDLPGQPAIFNDSHLTDWIGESTGGTDLILILTFSGLDDALTYDLVIGSGFIAGPLNVDTTWAADGLSATTDHSVGADAYVTLSTLSTDGAGNLVISSTDAGDADITVVSALTLTATTNPPVARPRLRYAGSQLGVGSGWRTAALVKPLDIDSDYVLGTDGYYLIGNNQRTSQPTYVSSWTPPTSTYGGNAGYALVDDPAVVPPGTATIRSGTANPGGSDVLVFSFVLNADLPAQLRLGIMIDGLDNASFNPDAIQLKEIGGGAKQSPTIATTSATYNDKNPDWLFFDVAGFSAGTQIGVYSSGGANTLQVFTFDKAPRIPTGHPHSLA
jgi:hypothetical protein